MKFIPFFKMYIHISALHFFFFFSILSFFIVHASTSYRSVGYPNLFVNLSIGCCDQFLEARIYFFLSKVHLSVPIFFSSNFNLRFPLRLFSYGQNISGLSPGLVRLRLFFVYSFLFSSSLLIAMTFVFLFICSLYSWFLLSICVITFCMSHGISARSIGSPVS